MLMIRVLGFLDIISGSVLILRAYNLELPPEAFLISGGYLIIKLFIFPLNIAGVVDFIAGILILLSFLISIPKILALTFGIWILLKAAQTFLIRG